VDRRSHVPMDKTAFEKWLESVSAAFLSLNDQQRNQSLDHLISLSGAVQLRHLSNGLETLLKRDFLRLLPLELTFYLLHFINVINSCTEVWQGVCRELGWRIDESIQDATHWKCVYLKAKRRMMQLKDREAFETSSLIGHSARVYALYYKDGLLCTGSDDLSAKLWDVRTGQCIYGIQTHTCAAVKFDEQKLVTGSFDNTIACWEWSTGAKIQHFRGHTGAVFSVDYNDDLDVLVSGSADFSVKVWSLSVGACLNTLNGHTDADKYEIKIWPLGREINCRCLKTLSVSEDRSISLQPRLQFDGRSIVCSSDLGVYQWDFASFEILRVIKMQDPANMSLLGFGEVFALLFDNHFLYVMDLRTEAISGRWPLPAYRKSKRGSSFLAGVTSWFNGLDGENDSGLVFATSMPDHSIHLVLWKENG
ncbi:unnamed protein product, partial [Menidia menidia]